jgi:hypothetical protein
MQQVPDRKKLRRTYLQKKGLGFTLRALATGLIVPACILGFLFTMCAVMVLSIPGALHDPGGPTALILFAMSSAACWLVFAGCKWGIRTGRQMSNLPYVPPITPSTLPPEEILVRSAQEPSSPSETLLRATMTGNETKAEELLRVAPGTPGEQEQ